MSTRINMKAITPEALKAISDYNCAYQNTCIISAKYREILASDDAKIAEVVEKRKKALEEGKTEAEAASLYPRLDLDNAKRKHEYERDEALAPYKGMKKSALALVPEATYAGYLFAMVKGMSAVPSKTTKVVDGKKEYAVPMSFTNAIKAFGEALGVGKLDDEKALEKWADIIRARVSGMKNDSHGAYMSAFSKVSFADRIIRATIMVGLEVGSWEQTDSYDICIKEYAEA